MEGNYPGSLGSGSGEGYQLELVQVPSQVNAVVSAARSQTEHKAMEAEVQALLAKGAVKKVHSQSDQFTSRLFVVPKQDGSLRAVINLKPLNSTNISKWRESTK